MGEQDVKISLLRRLRRARANTARYCVYYGEGRDAYDVRGRTAHEAIFNVEQRQLSLPELPAGLFAVQHLDARPGLGHLWIRGVA